MQRVHMHRINLPTSIVTVAKLILMTSYILSLGISDREKGNFGIEKKNARCKWLALELVMIPVLYSCHGFHLDGGCWIYVTKEKTNSSMCLRVHKTQMTILKYSLCCPLTRIGILQYFYLEYLTQLQI